jgi:hypothetical protein
VLIIATGKNGGVTYTAPATVSETSIQASLGALGEISVTFQRSGVAAIATGCSGARVRFDSGSYEGKIEFHGEEGYTEVSATSVPGNIDFWLGSVCGVSSGGSYGNSRARGAELFVRNPALGPELSVSERRPGAPAQISVGVSEYNGGIAIRRFTRLRMPAGHFNFDRRLRKATLQPPAPFAGSASFDRGKKAGQRWSGDLTVDMPGRADVPLTGGALRADLVPYE